MPPWVFGDLLRLVFSCFWKDKKDLVSRLVVVQTPSVGGFSVVDVKLKVQSVSSVGQEVRHSAIQLVCVCAFLVLYCL